MKKLLPILISGVMLFSALFVKGQTPTVSVQDSLALVAIYNSTRGERWVSSNNWLQGPVSAWQFVEINPNTGRVTGLNLAGNNLSGTISDSISQLTQLIRLDISQNRIKGLPDISNLTSLQVLLCGSNRLSDFPNLDNLPNLDTVDCSLNRLTFEDLIPLTQFQNQIPNLTILPQGNFGADLRASANEGQAIDFQIDDLTQGIRYNWFRVSDPTNQLSNGPALTINPVTLADSGTYSATISHPSFPGLVLVRNNIVLTVIPEGQDPFPPFLRDSTGRLRVTLNFFTNDQQKRAAAFDYLDRIGAESVPGESCLCGDLSSWYLPDEVENDSTGTIVIGAREIIAEACAEIPVQQDSFLMHWDYSVGTIDSNDTPPQYSITLNLANAPVNMKTVTVAIIDLGIERTHDAYKTSVWGDDNAIPCIADDTLGYNFFLENNQPFNDLTSHGTHIANTVRNFIDGIPMRLLSIQVGEQLNDAHVIDVVCALRYAMRLKADVINLSMGYRGPESDLLTWAISEMTDAKENIVLVTSSGNDGISNNYEKGQYGFWPGNLAARFKYVITVGAMDENNSQLAGFSNFGDTTVSVAAPGEKILSAFINNSYGIKSGTSMATPFVTAVAAYIRASDASLPASEVRLVLLNAPYTVKDNLLVGKIFDGRKLNVTVNNCSTDPQPKNDYLTVKPGQSLTINVLQNDCYETGIIPTNLTDPLASVNPATGVIKYEIPPNQSGDITFTYDLCALGNPANCYTATVTLHIEPEIIIGWWGIIFLMLVAFLLSVVLYQFIP